MADENPKEARRALLYAVAALCAEYLVDPCPDEQGWEDFDPDVGSLKAQAEEMLEKCN